MEMPQVNEIKKIHFFLIGEIQNIVDKAKRMNKRDQKRKLT